jgi:hypothetical protein
LWYAAGASSAQGVFGGGVVLALSFADSFIFEGLLGGVVREGLAFFLNQQRCLRCFVDGWGCLRASSLGGHRGLFFVAPTVGAKCWNLLFRASRSNGKMERVQAKFNEGWQ